MLRVQCRCSSDRAAMRLALPPPRRLSSLRIDCVTSCSHRQIHGSGRFHSDDDRSSVFPDSLQKTLEAHRASNRARLTRFIPNRPSEKEVHGDEISAQNKTAPEPPKATPSKPLTGTLRRQARNRPVRSKNPTTTQPQSTSSDTPAWVTRQLRWGGGSSNPGRYPWLAHCLDNAKCNHSNAMVQLDAEIRALEEYLTPTERERSRVDQLATSITKQLKALTPHPPRVIGSWQTGVASSHSDVDFILPVQDTKRSIHDVRKPSATRPQVLHSHRELLRKTGLTLQLNPMFEGKVHLSDARFPTLTAIHRSTGLRLRFHCGEGLSPSMEYIKDYLAEYPAVRPLYKATRLILESRGVFGAVQSSINSNTLLMLLVAFSKMNHGKFQRPNNLGDQLLAFLQTYGIDVNLKITGVAVDPPGWFTAEIIRDEYLRWSSEEIPAYLRGQRSLINFKRTAALKRNHPIADHPSIQDPANYMNDLGRSCKRTQELQNAWAIAHERLRKAVDDWDGSEDRPTRRSILMRGIRVNFSDFEKKRAILSLAPDVIY